MFGFSAILSVLKVVPTAVRLIEKLFGGKSGGEKQDAAVSLITAILPLLGVGKENEDSTAEFVEGITLLIQGTVKVLHAVGEFRHKDD